MSYIFHSLQDKYSNDSNRLLPKDPVQRAAVYQKMVEVLFLFVIYILLSICHIKYIIQFTMYTFVTEQ